MKSIRGEYIPRGKTLGLVTAPDGGTDEIIVTATRLTNWPAIILLAAMGVALFTLFNTKPKRRRRYA